MEMPKVDGVELVRRIRRMQPLERLPVIMVSSVEEKWGSQKGFEAGVDAYLPKDRLDGATLRKTLRNSWKDVCRFVAR